MPRRIVMPFFTDHNVPESACLTLIDAGHKVLRLRECMATDSKDPLVALACSKAGQILVTHDQDFRDLAKRLKVTARQSRDDLHRILLRCPEPQSATRIREHLSLIESEWKIAKARKDRLCLEIFERFIRIYR